jgi:hypothetical protein
VIQTNTLGCAREWRRGAQLEEITGKEERKKIAFSKEIE